MYVNKGGNKHKLFKNSLAFERKINIANLEKRRIVAQFRTSAHRLQVETGRFGQNNTFVPPDHLANNSIVAKTF